MLNEACPICFLENENCTENTPLFINMDCGHSLCETCYNEWHIKQQNPNCVICRQIVITPTNNLPPYSCIYCKIGFNSGAFIFFSSTFCMMTIYICVNNYFIASISLAFCVISLFMGLLVCLHHLEPALR